MRSYLLVICIFIVFASQAQRKLVHGRVSNMEKMSVSDVHVRNQTTDKITTSDENGKFRIPAQTGDTLFLTSVGFTHLMVIVENNWLDEEVNLSLLVGSIELDELTITSIPSIEEFKERVVKLEMKDSANFWYYGVPKPNFSGDKMVQTNKRKNPLFAILQPTDFLYYNFSKREKEKRKYYHLTQSQPVRDRVYKKFTRDWVKAETGLDGDILTSFIAFCDFDIYYLDSTPLLLIKENMMAKLGEFKSEGKG